LNTWQEKWTIYGIDEAFDIAATAALQGWDYPTASARLTRNIRAGSLGKGKHRVMQVNSLTFGSRFWKDRNVFRIISFWQKPRDKPRRI